MTSRRPCHFERGGCDRDGSRRRQYQSIGDSRGSPTPSLVEVLTPSAADVAYTVRLSVCNPGHTPRRDYQYGVGIVFLSGKSSLSGRKADITILSYVRNVLSGV